MKSAIARLITALLAAAVMVGPAGAQTPSGDGTGATAFGGRKQHPQKADKNDAQKPKVDDKAYNAALKGLPNKPYDPWLNAR